ncbi:MAG: hypothetical protein IJY71_07270 [Clostridia bacterium]|nr:hypothetical protein [Clostridia bacterium]
MKTLTKKLLVTVLALCLLCTAALGMVSCDKVNTVTQSEFSEAVIASFDAFYANHKDYANFGDVTLFAEFKTEDGGETEWSYTPDGATEPVKAVYENSGSYHYKGTYSVKKIGEDLYMSVDFVKEEKEVRYFEYDAPDNAPLTPTKRVGKVLIKMFFGVADGVYYVKAEESHQEGETELGEAEVAKTYKTFESKAAYEEAILFALGFVDEKNISVFYETYSTGASEMLLLMGGLVQNTEKDGVYTMTMDVSTPMLSLDDKTSGMVKLGNSISYNEKGPVAFNSSLDRAQGKERFVDTLSFSLEHTSSVAAEVNPFEGFTQDQEFDYESTVRDTYIGELSY